MSVRTFPYPAPLRDELKMRLRPIGVYGVHVTPCDEAGRKCAAWRADLYLVKARLECKAAGAWHGRDQ